MKNSLGSRGEKLLGAKSQPRSERMKKPGSPTSSQDNISYTSDFMYFHESDAELTPKNSEEEKEREKKHTSFTLCNVCNIQLNSAAQAQIHYHGKSHQKRLKQLSNGNLKNSFVRARKKSWHRTMCTNCNSEHITEGCRKRCKCMLSFQN
ncbi:PREDICTED: zinc finger protein 346-like [Thamnophis sirtalis]|uniref:Zinc finger protein 346-like n=1 Tax=Thamnophis sirtalis TaxID=35019 RepID=A0A6I9WWT8_9SAUR|nr:PREDICTED: zinc finger protein 346-like [Thamnophis sirtalis]